MLYEVITHEQFPNNITVFRFDQLQLFKNLEQVLFHLPEYTVNSSLTDNIHSQFKYLKKEHIHLNILNQRIDIMPEPTVIQAIKKQGYILTQTTAHEQYSTPEVRTKFGIPLHKLSVVITSYSIHYTKLYECRKSHT